jgi:hypothetical protein
MNPLKQLEACGQSPWLDYLKRSLIEKGELRSLIECDGLKGVTSNPSIFEKAIGETDEYADALQQFQGLADHGISAIYEHLAIADIRAAADLLRPVYAQTEGGDGYISLECSPYLANDTGATVAEALRLWGVVRCPNLMVKVPATPAGIPAIRQLIGSGLNINITLLFSVSVYEQESKHISRVSRTWRGQAARSPRSAASPASSSAVSIPQSIIGWTGLATKSWRIGCAARRRSPTRSSPTFATSHAGSFWPHRARRRNACFGLRPAPKIRPTGTRCMSRRSSVARP